MTVVENMVLSRGSRMPVMRSNLHQGSARVTLLCGCACTLRMSFGEWKSTFMGLDVGNCNVV